MPLVVQQSDIVLIFTALFSCVATCFGLYMTYAMNKLNRTQTAVKEVADTAAVTAKVTARKVDAVKVALEARDNVDNTKLDTVVRVTGETRTAAVAAGDKVDQVGDTLHAQTTSVETKVDDLTKVVADTQKVGVATHMLVNSAFLASLKSTAVLARRLADMTGDDADVKAAETAEAEYQDHFEKQKKVNEMGPLADVPESPPVPGPPPVKPPAAPKPGLSYH